MELIFKDKKLKEICNNQQEASRKWGRDNAKKLRQRLDDLREAETLEVFRGLPGRCHELKGDKAGQLSLDLKHPFRLIFEPVGNEVKTSLGLDWRLVKALQINGMEDTHG